MSTSKSIASRGRRRRRTLLVCVRNKGYEASLEARKIYVSIADRKASERDMVRVIDESGEDYLYPRALFRPIELDEPLCRALRLASR